MAQAEGEAEDGVEEVDLDGQTRQDNERRYRKPGDHKRPDRPPVEDSEENAAREVEDAA